jgi:arylsulfatase A-like enzyme
MQRRLPPGTDPASPAAIEQRYYEQAGLLDEAVERLLVALRQQGVYDESIVAVVADHGELLGEHGRRLTGHSPMLVDATVVVPLLLRIPGSTSPGVVSAQVSVVDLLPTFLEALGLPVPAGLDGRSVLHADPDPSRTAYSETFFEHFPDRAQEGSELISLRTARWKLLVRADRVELFDLEADPAEQRDVSSEHPDVREHLLAELAERRARWRGGAPPAELGLDASERGVHVEQLRALGYVE